jgi:hypothetical protein
MNIANKDARRCVENRVPFKGSHLFGEWQGKVYVVYSYGYHFPIYAYKSGQWYRNTDKYSVSTSRHQSQARPCTDHWLEYNTVELQTIIAS